MRKWLAGVETLRTLVCLSIEALAMHWTNVERQQQGYAIAYDEAAFMDLIRRGQDR